MYDIVVALLLLLLLLFPVTIVGGGGGGGEEAISEKGYWRLKERERTLVRRSKGRLVEGRAVGGDIPKKRHRRLLDNQNFAKLSEKKSLSKQNKILFRFPLSE